MRITDPRPTSIKLERPSKGAVAPLGYREATIVDTEYSNKE